MAQQLELFDDMSLAAEFADAPEYGHEAIRMLEAMWDEATLLIRRKKLDEIFISSKYVHLSLTEATLKLFKGFAVEPARVNALVIALSKARARPSRSEAIGLSPKQRLKRRSGHQAREPPLRERSIWPRGSG